jgi:hypothetical protein
MQKAALIAFVAIAVISCNLLTGKRIHGEGATSTEDRTVGNFDDVQSFGQFDISISYGQVPSVKVQAESNLQQYIEVSVDNNTLNIRHRQNYNFHSPGGIKILVTAPALRAARLSGSGNIRTENQIPAPDHLDLETSGSGNISYNVKAASVNAHISGSGNIEVSGNTEELEAGITGSGSIKAGNLDSKKTSVSISGSGNAAVVAKEKLNANISGSGDIYYRGQPEVSSHIAGSGTVVKEN